MLLGKTLDPFRLSSLDADIRLFKSYHLETRVAVGDDLWGAEGMTEAVFRTIGGERIMSKTDSLGATIVPARDMGHIHQLSNSLGSVLAIAAGLVVETAALTLLKRLQKAVDFVADTDGLRPIAVQGSDEIAQLASSFNAMPGALQESHMRQSQVVADAGHGLKNPADVDAHEH